MKRLPDEFLDGRTVRDLLERDHARLEKLLAAAVGSGSMLDVAAYQDFRAGLLRHIGMEEKILFPAARRIRAGQPLDQVHQARLDHGALAALLVPTPTVEIVRRIGALLALHNPLEEGPTGLYAACDALAAGALPELLARMRSAPVVPTAKLFDGPRAFAAIDRLLRAAGRDV
jgi:hypothetical protein